MIPPEIKEKAESILINQFVNSITFAELAEVLVEQSRFKAKEKIKSMQDYEIVNLVRTHTSANEATKLPAPKRSFLQRIKEDGFIEFAKRKLGIYPQRKGFITKKKK